MSGLLGYIKEKQIGTSISRLLVPKLVYEGVCSSSIGFMVIIVDIC